jgi:NADH:ubiquinone oxidoreductase subunit 6 (subunit J)
VIPGAPYLLAVIFGGFLLLTVGGALLAVLTTRIIRSVTGLALCSIGLAGLYYFLRSPFLALMEILIYVGAVCVTIIFGVMLTEPDEPRLAEARRREFWWGGVSLAVAAAIGAGVARISLRGPWPPPPVPAADGSIPAIGVALLTTYSLPFELISLVLLVAILGALAIARGGRGPA